VKQSGGTLRAASYLAETVVSLAVAAVFLADSADFNNVQSVPNRSRLQETNL
jgi:hypothetical protein